jgi:miniconductance mechanosensitive channel
MTKMVRQLPPDEQGLPLELYCFAADIRWEAYENLMSDIFDHLLASTGTFGLEVFENPASDDVRFLGGKLRGES